MKNKIEAEILRVLDLSSKTDDTIKLREYSLTIETLVMALNRLTPVK